MDVSLDNKQLEAVEKRLRKAVEKSLYAGHSGRKIIESTMREVGNVAKKESQRTAAGLPGNTPKIFKAAAVYKVTPLVKNIKGNLGKTRPPAVKVRASGKTSKQALRALERRGASMTDGAYSVDSDTTLGKQLIARRIGHFVGSGQGVNVYAKYGQNKWMDRAADKVMPVAGKQIVGALDTIMQEEVFQGRRATWYKNKLGGKIVSGGDSFADIVGS